MMREKRRSKRVSYDLLVELHRGARTEQLHTVDVSRHGCFLASQTPLPLRHVGKVTVHLPEGGRFSAVVQVSRVTMMGMGVSFFALSREAKLVWDTFFAGLREGVSRMADVTDDAVFVVKLRTRPALEAFLNNSYRVGGTYLRTPVLREIGSGIAMVVVHPDTDEEFAIRGEVVRLRVKRPKGVEIRFLKQDDEENAFERFVETGLRRSAAQLEEPEPVDMTSMDFDSLEFDIDVVDPDEDELDLEQIFDWDDVDETLTIDPSLWASLEDEDPVSQPDELPELASVADLDDDEAPTLLDTRFPKIEADGDPEETTRTGVTRKRKLKRKRDRERRRAARVAGKEKAR